MKIKLVEKYGPTVGRILLGFIFAFYGLDKLFGFMGSGYSGLVGMLGSKGFPLPDLFAVAAILVEAGGGLMLMLMLGFKARLGALALFLFMIPVTLVFHPAWADPSQMSSFLKNLALMGAMLYVMAHGAGKWKLKD